MAIVDLGAGDFPGFAEVPDVEVHPFKSISPVDGRACADFGAQSRICAAWRRTRRRRWFSWKQAQAVVFTVGWEAVVFTVVGVVFTVVEAVVFTEAAVVSAEVVRTAAAALVARVLTGVLFPGGLHWVKPTAEAHIEAVHWEAGLTAEAHIEAVRLRRRHWSLPSDASRGWSSNGFGRGFSGGTHFRPALAQPLRTADGIHLAAPEEASRMREPHSGWAMALVWRHEGGFGNGFVVTEVLVAGLAIAASADADLAEASADAVLAALAVAGAAVSVGDLAGDGRGASVGRDLAGVGAGVHNGDDRWWVGSTGHGYY